MESTDEQPVEQTAELWIIGDAITFMWHHCYEIYAYVILNKVHYPNSSKVLHLLLTEYHQISNISCTKSKNLNVSHFMLQLSLPNPLKPGVKSRMKM